MRNLEAIKKRINSIETNGKIAFVMKVLSTYKLQTFKKKFLLYQDYLMGFYQIFVNVVNDQQQSFEQLNRLFFPQPINQYQKTL